jgi:hypothetical protein
MHALPGRTKAGPIAAVGFAQNRKFEPVDF